MLPHPGSWVDWPPAVHHKVGDILISRLAGADVRLVRAGFGIGFKDSWQQALRQAEASSEEIRLNECYHAGTYGIPDAATSDAMRGTFHAQGGRRSAGRAAICVQALPRCGHR
jgi:1-aminocyclopropane-1-carboxylate deaminase/D-cysteine desulfhydrase-like pyridoxal-dependent ACC family enzyme